MIRRGLESLQTLGLLLPCLGLLLLPVLVFSWELSELLWSGTSPLLARFFQLFDAGGQSGLSRAIFRAILAAGCVAGLLLPGVSYKREGVPWGGLFLLLGMFSVWASPRAISSETEWECWALLLLLGRVLLRSETESWRPILMASLYAVVAAVCLQALWISVPATAGRLGGIFHHSNALSTFCVIVLPVLVWRASLGGLESAFAASLTGALTAVWLWSGSLTGASVLFGSLALLSFGVQRRFLWVGIVGLSLPALCNLLLPSALSVYLYPLLFLGLLLAAWLRNQGRVAFRDGVIATVALILFLVSFSLLTPERVEQTTTGLHKRDNSLSARLAFYSAGLQMAVAEPILGVGPGGFGHDYPAYQESVRYFSKFVHCLPIEVLAEWGGVGFVLLILGLLSLIRESRWRSSVPNHVLLWSFSGFLVHSLTGVQSQFPYLPYLLVLLWGTTSVVPKEQQAEEGKPGLVARPLLALLLLQLVVWNSSRALSHFDRALGSKLFKKEGHKAAGPVIELLSSGIKMTPYDAEAWYQYGLLAEALGHKAMAEFAAREARILDSRWAAPCLLDFRVRDSLQMTSVERALAIDPVNYPAFYRLKAELFLKEGEPEAGLRLLEERAELYSSPLLDSIADFRADDLKDQLVEYWVLVAILREELSGPREAEQALRTALAFSQDRVARLRRMVLYPKRAKLKPGPVVNSVLSQVLQQLEELPTPVELSP